jgi:hypothetical protein
MVGEKWGLADDSNNMVVFDPTGKVIFSVDGQVSDADIKKMIAMINVEIELLRNPPPTEEVDETMETEEAAEETEATE